MVARRSRRCDPGKLDSVRAIGDDDA